MGHPGFPRLWHWGLGAVNSQVGVVGISDGNPRALILPPDKYRNMTPLNSSNTANGRNMAAAAPSIMARIQALAKGQ